MRDVCSLPFYILLPVHNVDLIARQEVCFLCYYFYMSTYWLMIEQNFALSAKNHESALSLLLLFLLLLSRMLQAESTLPSL